MRFLFVDRITHLAPAQVVRGIKHITCDDYYLCPDEQGKLCFIPSLIGETLGQLAAWNVMVSNGFILRPVAGVVASARLYRPAYVGETLLLESFIDHLDESAVQYHSTARVGDEIVFTIENALGPLLPMEEFIHPNLIRRQFAEINRPGPWPHAVNTFNSEQLSTMLTGKAPPMQFDRILSCEPGVQLIAEKCITRAAPYFQDHFPNKPVLPLTVLLECKLNLAREFVTRAGFEKKYRVREMRRVKMSEFVYPGDVITTTVRVKRHDKDGLVLTYRTELDHKRICVIDTVMTEVL
jgi:3-hydroxymyristoyl/3-hydroxydecanoyl-(acyl carrier protein) dehydratase